MNFVAFTMLPDGLCARGIAIGMTCAWQRQRDSGDLRWGEEKEMRAISIDVGNAGGQTAPGGASGGSEEGAFR